MTTVQFFENFRIKLLRDIEISNEFNAACDGAIIEKTKQSGKGERGSWKVWILKKDSHAFASMTPSGQFYLTDHVNSHTCHADIERSDFEPLDNVQLPTPLKPHPRFQGLWT